MLVLQHTLGNLGDTSKVGMMHRSRALEAVCYLSEVASLRRNDLIFCLVFLLFQNLFFLTLEPIVFQFVQLCTNIILVIVSPRDEPKTLLLSRHEQTSFDIVFTVPQGPQDTVLYHKQPTNQHPADSHLEARKTARTTICRSPRSPKGCSLLQPTTSGVHYSTPGRHNVAYPCPYNK